MSEAGLLSALLAGLLSFLSPCVLPLIPAYLSYISGYAVSEIRAGTGRYHIFTRTLAFAAGFALAFTALGLLLSGASMLLGGISGSLRLVAGGIVALLGLNMIFDFLKFLDLEARFRARAAPRGYAGAFLLGLAFAAGWTPCVGPILASILLYASSEGNAGRSALLLAAYSTGLALPFFAAALFFDRLGRLMDWFKRHGRGVRIASGALLLALGAGMALGRLGAISSAAVRSGSGLRRLYDEAPGLAHLVAIALWALAAALPLAARAMRRRRLLTPGTATFLSLCAILALGEILGLWSTLRLVSDWLLFQGV